MKRIFPIPLLGLALAAWSPLALAQVAQEVVVLPGVVNSVGVLNGVQTQGPGTLTVGAQNINTSNNPGGAIMSDAANTASIVFTSSSVVTGAIGSTGTTFLNIAAGANGNTVTFNGPVFATTFSESGTGTVNFNGGFTSNTGSTMDFAGDGFINVGPGQTVKAAITNSAGADTGTLTLNGNSVLDGAVGAASGLKQIIVVGGNALITGQVNAQTYTLGANTLNVAGAFKIPVAGTINTTILSPSVYGQIVPVGAATIGNALQVNVTVLGPIANGTNFNIVDATSGTNGSTVTATDVNSTRYVFSAAPTTAGLVKITTTQIPLAQVVAPVVNSPTTPVPPAVNPVVPIVIAPVIDALPVTPTTTPLLTAITLLPTAPAVAEALAQLGPGTANLASPQVGYRVSQRFDDLLASELETQEVCTDAGQPNDRNKIRLEDASACQRNDTRSHLWVTGFDYFGNQGDFRGFEGYKFRILGAMLAYDMPLGQSAHAGLGVRYARSSLDGDTSSSHADIDSYQVTAYVGYAPGPWYLNGAIAYGWDNYSGSRRVVFTGVDSMVNANYSGNQFTAFGTTGYHFYVGDGRTVITPYATLQYTSLHADRYTETGDNAIDLTVNAQHYDFVESSVGGKIAHDFRLSGLQVFQPEFHADWMYSFGGDTMANTAAFASGGPTFTTLGLKPDRNTYNVGAGIAFGKIGKWAVEGVYDYFWQGQNYSAQQVMLNFVLHI